MRCIDRLVHAVATERGSPRGSFTPSGRTTHRPTGRPSPDGPPPVGAAYLFRPRRWGALRRVRAVDRSSSRGRVSTRPFSTDPPIGTGQFSPGARACSRPVLRPGSGSNPVRLVPSRAHTDRDRPLSSGGPPRRWIGRDALRRRGVREGLFRSDPSSRSRADVRAAPRSVRALAQSAERPAFASGYRPLPGPYLLRARWKAATRVAGRQSTSPGRRTAGPVLSARGRRPASLTPGIAIAGTALAPAVAAASPRATVGRRRRSWSIATSEFDALLTYSRATQGTRAAPGKLP